MSLLSNNRLLWIIPSRLFEMTRMNNEMFKCWRNALMLLITTRRELKSSLFSCLLSLAH